MPIHPLLPLSGLSGLSGLSILNMREKVKAQKTRKGDLIYEISRCSLMLFYIIII